MTDWFLYMIRCRDGSLYTGISSDVERRFAEHQNGKAAGSKYLKGRAPLILVFQQKVGSKSLALKIEHGIKKLSKAEKDSLIEKPGYFEDILRKAVG
jgi:putative endonuclease